MKKNFFKAQKGTQRFYSWKQGWLFDSKYNEVETKNGLDHM